MPIICKFCGLATWHPSSLKAQELGCGTPVPFHDMARPVLNPCPRALSPTTSTPRVWHSLCTASHTRTDLGRGAPHLGSELGCRTPVPMPLKNWGANTLAVHGEQWGGVPTSSHCTTPCCACCNIGMPIAASPVCLCLVIC